MSPLAVCTDCPCQDDCIDDGCRRAKGQPVPKPVAPAAAPPPASPRQPKLREGLWVVWRFKGNMGWSKGYVKESLAGGKVVRITDSDYSSANNGSTVAVADIDWYRQ